MIACGKPSGDSPLPTSQQRSSAHISRRELSRPPNPMAESVPFAIGQVIRRLVCKATAKLLT